MKNHHMENQSKFRRFIIWLGNVRLGQIWDKFRKPFNFCWKAGAAIFGIAVVISLGEALWDTCIDHLGLRHYYWRDEDLGKNIEIRHFSNNRAATFNKITDERLSPKMRWISCVPDRDSLTVFCDKEGRRGFLNVNTGKVVIEGQYKHAWHFSEGLAAVVGENGRVGFINHENEMVIPAVFDYIPVNDYIFKDGSCLLKDAGTGLYGAIDKTGDLKLKMEYSMIFRANSGSWYIRKDGKCGLADENLNIIFEPVYDNVYACYGNEQAYLTVNGVKQLVAYDGTVIQPFVVDEVSPLSYPVGTVTDDGYDVYEYAMHPYLVEVIVDYDCRGVMDSRTGKMVIPPVYSGIRMVSGNFIMAEIDGNEENNVLFTLDGRRYE